ncbi:MAG: GDP-mannose 4,6-dehydratase [Methanobacteriota archaeon]|nr:MAG: GDP-mannose 4,6-dehydratase [Euryarchaeota archaeon]
MAKTALVTGTTGQDGSFLSELLLSKGYEVCGLVRRLSSPNITNIQHVMKDLRLLDGDMTDQTSMITALKESRPDEIYNLAAQSFVATSFRQPVLTADVNGLGAVRLLEAAKEVVPDARIYQASTSELFGLVRETPQNENTPFHPRSPYGVSKLFAYWACVNYREAYEMHVSNGILYNHESSRRGLEFLTRKVTDGVARIAKGKATHIELGNLDPKRDWGYAPEYVDAMWRMLQQPKPDDYVIGTGESHTVREFVELAFREAGIEKWDKYVRTDPKHFRPAEVQTLCADPSKARNVLGWRAKTRLPELVKIMVKADLERVGG